MTLHPTAVIDASVLLGADVTIGAFTVIGPGVRIGDRTVIEHHVSIARDTELGEENHVRSFAALGGDPQDRKYRGEHTFLRIGNRNRIGEYVTLHRGTAHGRLETRIGDDGLFMAQAHVAHDCRVGSGVVFANAATLAGHVDVGDSATVGAYSGVHQFCRVGDHAFIGGYSVVTLDALPFVKTVGNRARAYGINVAGLMRAGFEQSEILALKACYRDVIRSRERLQFSIEKARARFHDSVRAQQLLNFIVETRRGICR